MMRLKILNPTKIINRLANTSCKSNNRGPIHWLERFQGFPLEVSKEQAMELPKLVRASEANKHLHQTLHPKLEDSILEASANKNRITQSQKVLTSKCLVKKKKSQRFKFLVLEPEGFQISREIAIQTALGDNHLSVMVLVVSISTKQLQFSKNSFKRLRMLFLKSNRKEFKMLMMVVKLLFLWENQPWVV